MFSMAVPALAKSLIVVMASLHPAAASPAPAHCAGRPGDTFVRHRRPRVRQRGRLAQPCGGSTGTRCPTPTSSAGGQRLSALAAPAPGRLDPGRPGPPSRCRRGPAGQRAHRGGGRGHRASTSTSTSTGRGDLACAGGLPRRRAASRRCVIARESQRKRPGRQPGLRCGQPLPGSYPAPQNLGYPGLPQDAPVSVQNAAFQQAYGQSGTSPWAPSDGC